MLASLSPRERQVYDLTFGGGGLTVWDAAARLVITGGAAANALYYARKKLARLGVVVPKMVSRGGPQLDEASVEAADVRVRIGVRRGERCPRCHLLRPCGGGVLCGVMAHGARQATARAEVASP